jgi:hypothetical protein
MNRVVQLCHAYLHNVLRAEDGWPLTTTEPQEGRQEEFQRADRFFAHKTLDAVAADLRFFQWNIAAWRHAMGHRRMLELRRSNDVMLDHSVVLEIEREIRNLGLDAMLTLDPEMENKQQNGIIYENHVHENDAVQQVFRDHEAFLRRTMPNDQSSDTKIRSGSETNPSHNPDSPFRFFRSNACVKCGHHPMLNGPTATELTVSSQNTSSSTQCINCTDHESATEIQQVDGDYGSQVAAHEEDGGSVDVVAVGVQHQQIHQQHLGAESVEFGPPLTYSYPSGADSLTEVLGNDAVNIDCHWTCSICMDDDVKPEDRLCVKMPSPAHHKDSPQYEQCGHFYCRECWTKYIQVWLRDVRGAGGGILTARLYCPHPQCLAQVTRGHIEDVVRTGSTSASVPEDTSWSHPLLELHDELALNSFVEGYRSTIRWCPGPNCGRIIVQCSDNLFVPTRDRPPLGIGYGHFTRCSTCHSKFCFYCGHVRENHVMFGGGRLCPVIGPIDNVLGRNNPLPAVNGRQDRRLDRNDAPNDAPTEDDVGQNDTDRKIRPCPKCSIPIEKNGGCAHMQCKCGQAFCWLCMDKITYHGQHFCGRETAGDIYFHHRRARIAPIRPTTAVTIRLPRMDWSAFSTKGICKTKIPLVVRTHITN